MPDRDASANDDSWTIVLLATRGLAPFVENALIGMARCGIDTGLVQLVFPSDAEAELLGIARAFGACPRLLDRMIDVAAADIPADYAAYGTPAFARFVKYRFAVIRAILAEGRRVIYADVDVAWLRNPLHYLGDVLRHYPLAIQTESNPVFPPSFCLGFLALAAADDRCFALIDHFIAHHASDAAGRPLQPVFRALLAANPGYLTTIFPLPEGLFPTGLLYGAAAERNEPPVTMSGLLQPFIFHGNWTVGRDAKRRLLDKAGAWFVPDAPALATREGRGGRAGH
jgi:hypothetical protein